MHIGDGDRFDTNWKQTVEASYSHFVRGDLQNQIQFAFRKHWETISALIEKPINELRVLEVGCGRGSLSAYFADNGAECHLLDISPNAIKIAKASFEKYGLNGNFHIGDCLNLPFDDGRFDVVFSIGLLEHFEDVRLVIEEKHRVLKTGGLMFNYIVPHIEQNIQNEYQWFNEILGTILPKSTELNKVEVFRSDDLSGRYEFILSELKMDNVFSTGVYPLPMISNSPSFPFTLLNENAEKLILNKFDSILSEQKNGNPWFCEETRGQAIIVTGNKRL
jgi:2-polyprenyl-3-methyl-5-hydroxy-6-metoxy-1,4-benzoquinol methylase